jgi:hypothetical protein
MGEAVTLPIREKYGTRAGQTTFAEIPRFR